MIQIISFWAFACWLAIGNVRSVSADSEASSWSRVGSKMQANSEAERRMHEQDIAALKVKAVYDYVQSRLPEGTFWECGTDLEEDIDLYLPSAEPTGDYEDVFVPLNEIALLDGKLDTASQEKIESILQNRSL